MTERTTTERFAAAVSLALQLPQPSLIALEITAGSRAVEDGLRGTAYDSDRVAGGTTGSHPERMLARRHPRQFPKDEEIHKRGEWSGRGTSGRDDLERLHKASRRAIDAIGTLNDECCSAPAPDDWSQALQDANTLHEAGYLKAALDVGRNVDGAALRFCHAIDTVRAIRDSWMRHDAPKGLAEENHAWCRNHLRIDVKRERTTRVLCQWCWRHVQDLADLDEPVELQLKPEHWPSEAMLRAKEAGRTVLLEREQQAWLRSHGLDPRVVHYKRQQRRSA